MEMIQVHIKGTKVFFYFYVESFLFTMRFIITVVIYSVTVADLLFRVGAVNFIEIKRYYENRQVSCNDCLRIGHLGISQIFIFNLVW